MHKKIMIGAVAALLGPMSAAELSKGRYMRSPDGHAPQGKSASEMAAEVKASFDAAVNAVKAIAEEALGKAKTGEQLSESVKTRADEALTGMNEAKARLDEIEQKMARGGGADDQRQKTPGQIFSEDEGIKAFAANPTSGKRVGVEVKAIISSLTTDTLGAAGDLIVPQRVGMVEPVTRRMTVRDLLTPGRTASNAIQYPVESGFVNNAATMSETAGSLKPQSDIKFDIRTVSVTTIAHWLLATRQILDDVPMLQSYIDGRLRYGLAYVEENQLLNGGGTGTDLNGIYTQATAFAAGSVVLGAGATNIDVLRIAMLQAALAELPATGHVLNPIDWAGIETLKDGQGRYLIGNPVGQIAPTLWGLPVVATQAMASGSFLTGAFRLGAQIFDRMDARVEISTEDSDNFRRNLVTILAEERLALAVYRPEAFIKGTFAAAKTDLAS